MSVDLDYQGKNLVFIVGCPRSGTTWLQRLLASHGSIHTGQESDIFDVYIGPQLRAWRRDIIPENSGRSAVGLGCYFKEEEFIANLRKYMSTLLHPLVADLKSGQVFIEKTPSHALYMPEILELLPHSKFIHIVRDPRNVVASLLAASKTWAKAWAPDNVISATSMWKKHVRASQDFSKMVSGNQYLEIRYEDLQQDTLGSMKNIAHNFLNLEWSEEDIHKSIRDNSMKQMKSKRGTPIPVGGEFAKSTSDNLVEPKGFIRESSSDSWRSDLSALEKYRLWRMAKKSMTELGYEWNMPW